MRNIRSSDDERTTRQRIQLQNQLKKLQLDMEAIFLDSINRNFEYEDDVIKCFAGDDKKIMKNMIDTEKGLWIKIKPIFDKAIENENIPVLLRCLKAWRDLNKTCLILTLKRLKELAEDEKIIDGNTLESETTCEDLLEHCGVP